MVQTIDFIQLHEGDRFIVPADLGYTGGVAIRIKTGDNTYKFEDNDNENSILPYVSVVKIIKLRG